LYKTVTATENVFLFELSFIRDGGFSSPGLFGVEINGIISDVSVNIPDAIPMY